MPKANLINIKKTTVSGIAISHLLIPNASFPKLKAGASKLDIKS